MEMILGTDLNGVRNLFKDAGEEHFKAQQEQACSAEAQRSVVGDDIKDAGRDRKRGHLSLILTTIEIHWRILSRGRYNLIMLRLMCFRTGECIFRMAR